MAADAEMSVDKILKMGAAIGGGEEEEEVTDEEANALVASLLAEDAVQTKKAAEPTRKAMSADAREALARGQKQASAAVQHDTEKNYEQAMLAYDAAVVAFSRGLAQSKPAMAEKLVVTMKSYLDRAQTLRLAATPRAENCAGEDRVGALEAMARVKSKSFR